MSKKYLDSTTKNTIAAILLSVGFAAAAPAATVAHFRSSGDFGCASGLLDQGRIGHLCVFSNTEQGSTTVFLSYISFTLETGDNFFNGFGLIPSTAFKATGTGATLTIAPASVPGFLMQGVPHSGTISVTWKEDRLVEHRFSGMSTDTFANGAFKQKFNGMSSDKSAATSGTFFGSNFAGFNSVFGKTSSMQIAIEK